MTPVRSSVPDAIATAIRAVLHDTGRDAKTVEPPMLLAADLGLDSLDLAQTIVLLERSLGIDPFRQAPAAGGRPSIRTVGDLITIYTSSLPTASPSGTAPHPPTPSPSGRGPG